MVDVLVVFNGPPGWQWRGELRLTPAAPAPAGVAAAVAAGAQTCGRSVRPAERWLRAAGAVPSQAWPHEGLDLVEPVVGELAALCGASAPELIALRLAVRALRTCLPATSGTCGHRQHTPTPDMPALLPPRSIGSIWSVLLVGAAGDHDVVAAA